MRLSTLCGLHRDTEQLYTVRRWGQILWEDELIDIEWMPSDTVWGMRSDTLSGWCQVLWRKKVRYGVWEDEVKFFECWGQMPWKNKIRYCGRMREILWADDIRCCGGNRSDTVGGWGQWVDGIRILRNNEVRCVLWEDVVRYNARMRYVEYAAVPLCVDKHGGTSSTSSLN